jgi:hypothetical protein
MIGRAASTVGAACSAASAASGAFDSGAVVTAASLSVSVSVSVIVEFITVLVVVTLVDAASTGVTGLTASLPQGLFANGAGNLSFTISGTPSAVGTATFALNIGGQACSFTLTVVSLIIQYPAGSVFCASGPTAIVDVTNPTTGKTWMDRNLGASQVATSSTDAASYGDLYQWGRRADGHQCRTSPTTATLSSVDQPAHGNFILAPNAPNDWRSPQNNNLWQGVTGVNNPCPSGYRVPTQTEK